MSLHPRQPCTQHASTPAQPTPHPLGLSRASCGSGVGLGQWHKGLSERGAPTAGGLSRPARSGELSAGGQQLGQRTAGRAQGGVLGRRRLVSLSCCPPGVGQLLSLPPSRRSGRPHCGHSRLCRWQAPRWVPVSRGALGCRGGQGRAVPQPGQEGPPPPGESSEVLLETPGGSGHRVLTPALEWRWGVMEAGPADSQTAGAAGSQGRQWSEQEGGPGSFEGKATAGGALDRPQALRSRQGGVRGWGRWRARVGAPPHQGHPTLVVSPPLVTPHPGPSCSA